MSGAGRVLHNLPLSLSVLRGHLHHSRAKVASVVLRRAPQPVRARTGSASVAARRPDLAALALAADGRGEDAAQVLASALPTAGARTLGRIAEAAATLHEPGLAQQAMDGIPAADRDLTLRALIAADQGHLGAALELADHGTSRAAARLTARLRGEVELVRAQALRESLASPPGAPTVGPSPPERVLHVVTNALPERQAGYTIRTHGIATAQRARGLDARVVTRLGFPVDTGVLGAAPHVCVDGVPYERLLPATVLPPRGRARQDVAVRELDALVERVGSQLLHAHSLHENAQVALRVGHARGLPVVYEARGFIEETWRTGGGSADSDFYRWSRDSETLCMSSAQVVITLAEAMRQDIVDRGVDPQRVMVVPNAVPESFTAPLPPGASTRERLGIGAADVVFGTVSTLNHYEGLETVLAALRLLEDPQLRLLVVGDGPARPALQALAEPLGDRVVFTGRVPHALVRAHLAAIDVFVVPRHVTPVTVLVPPIKPLEAMAVGIPVLASDLPPLVEIVRPGRFGEVATAGDPSAWADQMASLGYAPEHVRTLGEHARRFVARKRTWAAAVHRYEAAYSAAVRH